MKKKSILLTACFATVSISGSALAVQFPFLDAAYVQEIYTGPLVGGPGMAWTNGGAMLTRDGSNIYEYSLTQNSVHQGTNVHGFTTHAISGLNTSGYGMTNALDGFIYTTTSTGLQRFNPNSWASPAQNLGGTVGGSGYGIHAMADGRIAYVAGGGTNQVFIYDPVATTNTLIYTNGGLIDDIAVDSAGNIALAGQTSQNMIVISNTGTVLNNFVMAHFPDGLAFGDGVSANSIFSNNNDGTITRLTYGAGYTGTPVAFDIASGSQAYGDLAEVGPDCAFYVSQFDNFGLHGSTPGVGTHWDNGVTNNEPSIIRISRRDGNCDFYHVDPMPEPGTFMAIGAGLVFLIRAKKRTSSSK